MQRSILPINLDSERSRRAKAASAMAVQLSLETGGNPPDPPDMERRIEQLESDVKEIKGILGRLEPLLKSIDDRLRKVEIDVAAVTARVAALPTSFQIVAWLVTTIVAVFGLVGGTLWGAARLFHP